MNKIDGTRESLTSARSRLGDAVVPDDLLEALCVAVLAFRGKDTQLLLPPACPVVAARRWPARSMRPASWSSRCDEWAIPCSSCC